MGQVGAMTALSGLEGRLDGWQAVRDATPGNPYLNGCLDLCQDMLTEIHRLRDVIRVHTDCPCADVQVIKRGDV
jgi:hypothetical protein